MSKDVSTYVFLCHSLNVNCIYMFGPIFALQFFNNLKTFVLVRADFAKLLDSIPGSRTDPEHLAVPGPVLELIQIFWRFRVRFLLVFAHGSGPRVPGLTRAQHWYQPTCLPKLYLS